MSKKASGLFWGTLGTRSFRMIPGIPGIVTGGSSQKLGKNLMQAMGLKRGTKWKGYQAQHIIPVELRNHPVLKKIGFNLDDASNGIFLRKPKDDVSALSRHEGYHSPYSKFVEKMLDSIDINASIFSIQKEVKSLQNILRKMQLNGIVLYQKQGASTDLYERTYNRIISTQKG
ncbi:MAG: AHH domain-containing protein [Lachnospiraceae bacterium]|nr:AHH domain-containing protein [Lachnospiraceae bacterium]MBQ6638821.1 AHH domain-containing protein [Lachnospiraceae bacterium]